ncbi:MAG: glycosyltransferase, partial [Lachnospiraceae bacterium]|nr:glycosyltransferase [Lachnospiraceae bacterium]
MAENIQKEQRGRRLFVVIPCYNEEEVLPETAKRLKEKLASLKKSGMIAENSRVLFVNDGSADRTWELIRGLHEEDPMYQGIDLARNSGHQNALVAGLFTAAGLCDMTISMDADLQDDINVIDQMVE